MHRDQISEGHGAEVDAASQRFRDHESMNRNRVLDWLEQFDDGDLPLALLLLERLAYYDTATLRAMTRQMAELVRSWAGERGLQRIVFVPVGGPETGSSVVARALRDV